MARSYQRNTRKRAGRKVRPSLSELLPAAFAVFIGSIFLHGLGANLYLNGGFMCITFIYLMARKGYRL